ncbi:PRC-barrel domain-containing protein [Pseudooceanicola sp. C21-150M6]|uniref:PRC-barrel domain-containing protein n=1 Tax=Pseudooceanicola sp. C21-150M6 TaxID=3434355 RepID=UPI003D7F2C31
MKHLLLTTALIAAGTAGTAFADTTATMDANAEAQASSGSSAFMTEASEGAIRASDFLGMRVYAAADTGELSENAGTGEQWEDIGEINDVIMGRDGQVTAVLVDIGGFLGIGERQVAANLDQIQFVSDSSTEDAQDFFLVLNADPATLEEAPAFGAQQSAAADTMTDDPAAMDTADATVDEGMTSDAPMDQASTEEAVPAEEEPTDMAATEEAVPAEDDATDMAATEEAAPVEDDATDMAATEEAAPVEDDATDMAATEEAAPAEDDATDMAATEEAAPVDDDAADMAATEEAAPVEEDATDMAATDPAMDPAATGTDMAATEAAPADPMEGYSQADAGAMTAESLEGARVYDANDKWIGEISELIVAEDGQITDAIVDVGGFLGLGEKPVALKLTDLQIMRQDEGEDIRISTAMAEEELESLPEFEKQ